MSNILVIVGSGFEKGNTNQLSDSFIEGAMQAGHQVTKVNLSGDIVGCVGCGSCQLNENHCMIKDKMEEIYPLFEQADTIVLASPLYFWSISGRLKSVIDRLYAISTKDIYPHKNTVLLMTCGSNGFYAFEQAVSFYRFFTNALGWTNQGMVLAGGCTGKPGNKVVDPQYLQSAYQLGMNIYK